MAIEKVNDFIIGPPAQNLSNMGENVDLNALSDDKTQITVNFGTSPATVTIKVGSIIEVNGSRYKITGSDESFQMSNATHNYITFTDSPGTTFGSAASIGTYTADKQGFYQAGNLIRTLKWYIDQVEDTYYYDIDHLDLGEDIYDIDVFNLDGDRLNSYIVDTNGSVITSNQAINPSGAGLTLTGTSITLKKPIQSICKVRRQVSYGGGLGDGVEDATVYLDYFFESSWRTYRLSQSIPDVLVDAGDPGPKDVTSYQMNTLNPGQYRYRVVYDALLIGGSITITLTHEVGGVYGQTSFTPNSLIWV